MGTGLVRSAARGAEAIQPRTGRAAANQSRGRSRLLGATPCRAAMADGRRRGVAGGVPNPRGDGRRRRPWAHPPRRLGNRRGQHEARCLPGGSRSAGPREARHGHRRPPTGTINLISAASTSTRITDPDAFATAFARGVEHPKVREALDMAFDPRRMPRDVTVPIADLLGPDGHRYCTGWQLRASRWEHENRADQAGLLAGGKRTRAGTGRSSATGAAGAHIRRRRNCLLLPAQLRRKEV